MSDWEKEVSRETVRSEVAAKVDSTIKEERPRWIEDGVEELERWDGLE